MDNKYMPYEDLKFIGEMIEKSNWIYAKSMPQNPHFYMLRKEVADDTEFVRFVKLIREYGYRYKFAKSWYVQFNVNNWYYWTMGWPILERHEKNATILINRKECWRGLERPYDHIASDYEGYFANEIARDEDVQIAELTSRHNLNGRTLEVGCGSGMVTRNLFFNSKGYLGIDPSIKMLERFKEVPELANLETIHTDFESFYSKNTFNCVFATYGAASYVRPEFWGRLNHILAPGGSFMLMFYADKYSPATHILTGTLEGIPYYSASEFPADTIAADIVQNQVGNYVVVEGIMK